MPEFVSVQVPVERVQEVYELLGRPPARPAVAHHVTEGGYPAGWSRHALDRMFVESSDAMRRILLAIAGQSPRWVTTAEIAASSDLTSRQVVASFGPFEKRVRGRYGMSLWPFEAREFVDAGIFKYSMSPQTAERILELAAQVEQHEQATSLHA
jgi:hypothetical protein